MTPLELIPTYYPKNNDLKKILLTHGESVAQKAINIAQCNPDLKLNETFLYEAAMLHDIGIFLTRAERIHCLGSHPYICHGYLGAQLVRDAGFLNHANVCERHTGAGISLQQIIDQNLPLPHREMIPLSLEEEVICFADKFFSKTHLDREKTPETARKSLEKYGEEGLSRFDSWCERFL